MVTAGIGCCPPAQDQVVILAVTIITLIGMCYEYRSAIIGCCCNTGTPGGCTRVGLAVDHYRGRGDDDRVGIIIHGDLLVADG